jgi:hypothetical protein
VVAGVSALAAPKKPKSWAQIKQTHELLGH